MSEVVRRKAVVIINPNSGTGKAVKHLKRLQQCMSGSEWDYRISMTTGRGDAQRLTQEALKEEVFAVIAVGGDGTVNEVGSALINSEVILGIVPTGSGNGLARHLDIPISIQGSMDCINKGNFQTIDTGDLNGLPFLNIAGIGFDAAISHAFASRYRRGLRGYIDVILKQLKFIKSRHLSLTTDKETFSEDLVMLSVANGSQYGNNARIAPMADTSDGAFDICMVKSLRLSYGIKFASMLMKGGVEPDSFTSFLRTSRLEVNNTGGIAHVDGEPVLIEDPATFTIHPSSLNVFCP